MNEARHILNVFNGNAPKQFLSFGEWPEVQTELLKIGCKGIVADHRAFEDPSSTQEQITYVHGPVSLTNHYVQVGGNTLMRGVTYREILDRFPGPFDILLINVCGYGKELATCEEVWTSWPRVICVKSEGREQEIMNLAAAHSYSPKRVERDSLILARPE